MVKWTVTVTNVFWLLILTTWTLLRISAFYGEQGMTRWRLEMNGKWWWSDGDSLLPDGEGCLSGWVTLWALVSKQIRVKTSTRGEQLDEVCGINMLLKPVFARLCPSVPPARPDNDWYNLLFPGQQCTACSLKSYQSLLSFLLTHPHLYSIWPVSLYAGICFCCFVARLPHKLNAIIITWHIPHFLVIQNCFPCHGGLRLTIVKGKERSWRCRKADGLVKKILTCGQLTVLNPPDLHVCGLDTNQCFDDYKAELQDFDVTAAHSRSSHLLAALCTSTVWQTDWLLGKQLKDYTCMSYLTLAELSWWTPARPLSPQAHKRNLLCDCDSITVLI